MCFPKYLEKNIIQDKEKIELMIPFLIRAIRQLEKGGADFIILPCNTLHGVLPELRKNTKKEIIDIIEETAKSILKQKYSKVGIISTSKTRTLRIYDRVLKGVKILYPTQEQQGLVSGIILKIIERRANKEDKDYLDKIIKKMLEEGAEKIILACTDLSNIVEIKDNILDTREVLVKSIKNKMRNN